MLLNRFVVLVAIQMPFHSIMEETMPKSPACNYFMNISLPLENARCGRYIDTHAINSIIPNSLVNKNSQGRCRHSDILTQHRRFEFSIIN